MKRVAFIAVSLVILGLGSALADRYVVTADGNATTDTGPVADCTGTQEQDAAGTCFDGATQAELDAHAGDSTAHHTPRWIESALIAETDTYTAHYAQMRVPVAVAGLDISCSLAAGDGVDLDVEDRSAPNTTGSSIVTGTCTCGTSGITTCTLSQTTLGAGRFLSFSLANAAVSDDGLRIHVSATY